MLRHRSLTLTLCLLAAGAGAQSPDEFSHPIGLFADMAADTLTQDIFNHHAPLPGLRLAAYDPVPGHDLFLDAIDIACADLDGDGWTDVVLGAGHTAGDPPSRLLWGRPDGFFDLAQPSPLPALMTRVVRADVDGDGRTDLVAIVHTGGSRRPHHDMYAASNEPRSEIVILRNNGDRTFAVQPLGLAAASLSVSDLDGDRWLDIIAVQPSMDDTAAATVLVLRGGPEGFAPPRAIAAPVRPFLAPRVACLDLAGAGRLQPILFSNHILDPWPAPHVLDDPLGQPAWRPLGLLLDGATAALAQADIDRDGRPELLVGVTDYAGGRNKLLLSDGAGRWHDIGREAGLWAGYNYTYGAAWGDVDNDGRSDLWQCRFFADGRSTRSQLFWNRGDSTFVNATAALSRPASPSSLRAVWIDSDRDGRLDLLAAFNTPYTDSMPFERCRPLLYRNHSEAGGWLQVELSGRPPNTDALGAVITAWTDGRPMWRHLDDGSASGGACPPLEQHFGLGGHAAVDSVVVLWPQGGRQVWRGLAGGRRHVLVEE